MKELVILSGKGGTGKTSLAAALISLASQEGKKVILADADVDAADLFILTAPKNLIEEEFFSGYLSRVKSELCDGCGRCVEACRFKAIELDQQKARVSEIGCEGCAVCELVCPQKAITMEDRHCGLFWEAETRFGKMFHARLNPAGENSGKLVAKIRERAREAAKALEADLILVDGPPGIGCPVVASLTGAGALLAVAEPGLSSLHDLKRLLALARHFGVPSMVLINKADLAPELSQRIKDEAEQAGALVVGEIPWSKTVLAAQLANQTLPEYLKEGDILTSIKESWEKICQKIKI